jgi:hypothetical protein
MQAFSNTKVNETWLQQLHFESMARLRLVTAALMASFIWTRLRVLLALRDASEEAPNESFGRVEILSAHKKDKIGTHPSPASLTGTHSSLWDVPSFPCKERLAN